MIGGFALCALLNAGYLVHPAKIVSLSEDGDAAHAKIEGCLQFISVNSLVKRLRETAEYLARMRRKYDTAAFCRPLPKPKFE